jgi:hypothetical protein
LQRTSPHERVFDSMTPSFFIGVATDAAEPLRWCALSSGDV